MSRLLLLMIFGVWLMATGDPVGAPSAPGAMLGVFLGGYVLLVMAMRVWSVWLGRNCWKHAVGAAAMERRLRLFSRGVALSRAVIPAWLGVGAFWLGWEWMVDTRIGAGTLNGAWLPSVLLGTLPAIAAWMGLWWAQYPAERALREFNVLEQLRHDLPLQSPSGLRQYLVANLRLQLLFLAVPVLMIVALHDVVMLCALHGRTLSVDAQGTLESITWLVSAAVVFLIAPEVLRRVLQTEPMPDGPLRRRLEAMCRRAGVRYRRILLWHTNHYMGNAAVMGVLPRVRYILLSDMLLETMPDDQIEAVFAHEMGHVVHRHMIWLMVFIGAVSLALSSPIGGLLELPGGLSHHAIWSGIEVAAVLGASFALFGFLHRRLERQADVYAARTMEMGRSDNIGALALEFHQGQAASALPGTVEAPLARARGTSYVGRHGAALFAAALHRVARVNNISVTRNEWLHGSIASRMRYLHTLSEDPELTGRFDRFMSRLYCIMLAALLVSAFWVAAAGM